MHFNCIENRNLHMDIYSLLIARNSCKVLLINCSVYMRTPARENRIKHSNLTIPSTRHLTNFLKYFA